MWRNQSQWHFCVVKMTFIFTSIYGFLLQALKQDNKKFAQMYTVFYTFQSQSVGCFSICINTLSVLPVQCIAKTFILANKNWVFSLNQEIHLGLSLLPALFSIFLTKDTEKMVVFSFYLNTSCVNIGTSKLTQAVPQPIFDKMLAVQKGETIHLYSHV